MQLSFPPPGGGIDSPEYNNLIFITMPANYWKVWLRENLLTKDVDNDYIAEVSTEKNTLRNEDIARMIVEEGSEIKYDTLQSVINQHDRISGHLCSGASACRCRRVVLRCVC